MSVGEYCNRDVVITGGVIPILEVAQLMRHYHVGDVVIVERHGEVATPVGILTDRDIVVEVLAEGVNPDTVTAADVMSRDLLLLNEGEAISSAIERMHVRGVRRAPVIDNSSGLIGLLSVDDLIEIMAEQLQQLSTLFKRQQVQEQQQRD
jgi:CBS domain-containing protein